MVHPARAGLTRVESAPARANRRCRLLCWPSRCLQPRDLRSRPIWHLNHLGPPRLDPVARAFLFSTPVRCQPARPAEQPGATSARRRRPQDTTRCPPSPRGTWPGVWGQLVAPVWTCVGPIPPPRQATQPTHPHSQGAATDSATHVHMAQSHSGECPGMSSAQGRPHKPPGVWGGQ